jgi:hypothetical protein
MRYLSISLPVLILIAGCGDKKPKPKALPAAPAPLPARNNEVTAAADNTLVDWLQSGDEDYIRAGAILARKRPSDATRQALMALASGRERAWPLRQIGCDALQDINHPDVVSMWLAMLDEPYEPAVARAAKALAPFKNPDHVPNLATAYINLKSKEILNQQSPARFAIVQALQQIGDARALPVFLQGLKSPDYNVRNTSVYSIQSLKLDEASLQRLIQLIKEAGHPAPSLHDIQYYHVLFYSLNANAYKPAAPVALEIVRKPHHSGLSDTLFALVALGGEPGDYDALTELLKAEWPRTRTGNHQQVSRCVNLIRAIANTGRKEAAGVFIDLLKDGATNNATFEALKYLTELATEPHVDALIELHARSTDDRTRQSLAIILNSGRFPVRYNNADKKFTRIPDPDKTPLEK